MMTVTTTTQSADEMADKYLEMACNATVVSQAQVFALISIAYRLKAARGRGGFA